MNKVVNPWHIPSVPENKVLFEAKKIYIHIMR